MPREPAESDEGPRTTHWIRMLCAPFLCSGRRRSAKSRRMPGGRPAAACLRCGGQSCGRTTKSLFAAAISLPLSAPPPGGAFRGAFFCPPLAPPACPVTANQGCDVDETPSPHPNLPHPPAQNWEACDVCFCCEAPTLANPACMLWDSQSGPAPPAQLIMLILGPGPPNVPGSLLHPALGSATHAD